MDTDNQGLWQTNYYRIGRAESDLLHGPYEHSLYMALCYFAYGSHYVAASQATLAKKVGISVRKVGQLLPKFVAYGLIRRASAEERATYQRNRGHKPPTVLWKLLSVATEDTKPATLYEQATAAAANAGEEMHKQQQAVAYTFTNYWKNHTGQHTTMPAFLKLLQSIPAEMDRAAVLAEAVNITLASPRNNPYGYLDRVLKRRLQALSDAPDIHQPTAPAYDPREYEWDEDDV